MKYLLICITVFLSISGIPVHFFNAFSGNLSLKTYLPPQISESSGLAYTDGNLWTHNDKGGIPALFKIDTTDGSIKQTVFIDNYPNIDWEDITSDKEHIYIGDFGNNFGVRKDLKILIVDKSSITNERIIHLNAKAIVFSYEDQKKFIKNNLNNFDCESMISMNESLYLFTKDRGDNKTRVYKVSKNPGSYVLSSISNFNVSGRVCGASFDPVNNELALLGYMQGTIKSFLWIFKGFKGDQFFEGSNERIEIGRDKIHWKTEGIAYQGPGRAFISCENTDTEKAGLYIYSTKK